MINPAAHTSQTFGSSELWHALPIELAAARLESSAQAGLSQAEARARLLTIGPNVLPEELPPGVPQLLLRQFQSILVYVLLAAAVLTLLLGDELEFAAIVVIAILNAALGFAQEYRAERALAALKSLAAPAATVLRDGQGIRVAATDVVPGDLLLLEAGDVVAADARVAEAVSLSVSEAILTGESAPVDKTDRPVGADAELADRVSMVFQGTQVARGHGRAVVTATGRAAEMGRIASEVATQSREQTPLQKELARVGRALAAAAGSLCATVFVVGVLRGVNTEEMLLTSASLAVAAIPEGLPAAATIVLALGVQRMAAGHVIVRRLSSVETLGSATTIFTDKTGTLTQNRMQVQETWSAGDEADLLLIAVLCNNATPQDGGAPASGDPTEIALLAWAGEQGTSAARLQSGFQREAEIPFEAERARMTVVVKDQSGKRLALTKGAPDVIIPLLRAIGPAPADAAAKRRVADQAERMAESGMRVLALAKREVGSEEPPGEAENELTLVGLVGLADPLRPEAAAAVERASQAGIHVVMLTGDQPATAASIARRLGLQGDVITGREVHDSDLASLAAHLERSSVFARVTSEHKMRIIQASRRMNEVVAMTGDGVNDAPALRAADIGIAMGKAGTDVAREASDMVLTDDNFSSIVVAVEEGRTIHANISRFIHFLLSCNTAEILVVFLALLVAGEAVFTPLQILFVNLITDGFPALALGVEPPGATILRQHARMRRRDILSVRSLTPIVGMGSLIAAATMAAFGAGWLWEGLDTANSMAFATVVAAQLSASLVFRSETEPLFALNRNDWLTAAIGASIVAICAVFLLDPLRETFGLEPLSLAQFLCAAALSVLPLLLGELVKASRVLARLHLTPDDSGP